MTKHQDGIQVVADRVPRNQLLTCWQSAQVGGSDTCGKSLGPAQPHATHMVMSSEDNFSVQSRNPMTEAAWV
jgi:hypothetical protein